MSNIVEADLIANCNC